MNAAIRAAALVAISRGAEVFGVQRGYRGLVDGDFRPLTPDDVVSILRDGGTVLGSSRCPELIERAVRDRARASLLAAGIDRLLVIGGNGSLTGALALSDAAETGDHPLLVAGVPASIDNDVGLTGLCIGVDTAMNTIVDACDKIADTATSHGRTFLVEVMGRDCGYLAMTSAIASGADIVLFPEADRTDEELVDGIVRTVLSVRRRSGRAKRVIAIKSEGVRIPTDRLKQLVDERLHAESSEPGTEGGDPRHGARPRRQGRTPIRLRSASSEAGWPTSRCAPCSRAAAASWPPGCHLSSCPARLPSGPRTIPTAGSSIWRLRSPRRIACSIDRASWPAGARQCSTSSPTCSCCDPGGPVSSRRRSPDRIPCLSAGSTSGRPRKIR
jgi:6-phosphofructokinase